MVDTNLGQDAGWLPDPGLRAERAAGYPSTYQPVSRAPGVRQDLVFDPALKHFPNAFVAGEPEFDDPTLGTMWRAHRRRALDLVLAAVARSPRADDLVLRGGMTMRYLCGDTAREPGDLDLVARPGAGRDVFTTIVAVVRDIDDADIRIDVDNVQIEDIWTYERADGRRAVFRWYANGVPDGIVQVDVVFDEDMPREPESFPIPGSNLTIASVGAELALGWTLMWLHNDNYPQLKDLYDAVLLAERTRIEPALVAELVGYDGFGPDTVLSWGIEGDVGDLLLRLQMALALSWFAAE